MNCGKKGYKVLDFLNKTWVSIITFEIIFVVQDPLLTKDYFWIGIAAIFTPHIYNLMISYMNIIKEKSMFFPLVILALFMVAILFINKPIHADSERLGVITWALSFNFIFLLFLKIIFTKLSNWIKEIKSKHSQLIKLIILLFIYLFCLWVAFYHNDIIQTIRNVLGLSK